MTDQKSNQSLVSVIVPVYKVEQYIDRCVQSIVDQTYSNLELLLIDDGSPDHSGEMCEEWTQKDIRIRVFHKPNGGVSSARNLGLDNAQGEWVMFVDSDDWIEKDYIANFDLNSDCDIQMQGYSNDFFDRKSEARGFTSNQDADIATAFVEATKCYVIYGPVFKLIKRSLIDTDRFDNNYSLGEDYLFNLHIFQRAETFKLIMGNGYHYSHERAESLTKVVHPYQNILNLYNTCDYLRNILFDKCPTDELRIVCNHRHFNEIVKFILKDFFTDKKNGYIQYKRLIEQIDLSVERSFGLLCKYKYIFRLLRFDIKIFSYMFFKLYYNFVYEESV